MKKQILSVLEIVGMALVMFGVLAVISLAATGDEQLMEYNRLSRVQSR